MKTLVGKDAFRDRHLDQCVPLSGRTSESMKWRVVPNWRTSVTWDGVVVMRTKSVPYRSISVLFAVMASQDPSSEDVPRSGPGEHEG